MAQTTSTIQLIFQLPPQLLQLLVICAKPIKLIAQLTQTITWSHPSGPWPSWILLFSYWLICSILPQCLYYGLPNLIIALILLIYSTSTKQQQQQSSTISTHPIAVQQSFQHLQLIADHYAHLNQHLQAITSTQNITLCLTTLPISLLICQLIPLRSILIHIGTILILWSSPWFTLLRKLIYRSPFILLLSSITSDLFLRLRFHPLQRWNQFIHPHNPKTSQSILSSISTSLSNLLSLNNNMHDSQGRLLQSDSLDLTQEIEFCLTIFENQRWWMGLDWTPNLLPHERANWTDSENQPVASPTSFKLPEPKQFGEEAGGKVRRRVEWSWVDPEWNLVDKQTHQDFILQPNLTDHQFSGDSPSHSPSVPLQEKFSLPINPTPPQSPDLSLRRSHNRSASQAASLGNTSNLDSEIVIESLRNSGLGTGLVNGSVGNGHLSNLWEVDSNGWQYGDNHWEKMSKKSGIGRYTRRRAWTRKARLLSSIITPISHPSDSHPHSHSSSSASPPPVESPKTMSVDHPTLSSPSRSSPAPSFSSSSSKIIDPKSTIIQPSPSSASTALSLNLKRSLGLLRRK